MTKTRPLYQPKQPRRERHARARASESERQPRPRASESERRAPTARERHNLMAKSANNQPTAETAESETAQNQQPTTNNQQPTEPTESATESASALDLAGVDLDQLNADLDRERGASAPAWYDVKFTKSGARLTYGKATADALKRAGVNLDYIDAETGETKTALAWRAETQPSTYNAILAILRANKALFHDRATNGVVVVNKASETATTANK